MNSILKLSGPIGHRPAPKGGGTPSLPQGTKVTERDLTRLLNSLSFCTDYWKEVPYDIPPPQKATGSQEYSAQRKMKPWWESDTMKAEMPT